MHISDDGLLSCEGSVRGESRCSTSSARSVGKRFLWLSTSAVYGVLANAGKDSAFVGCCGDDLERAAREV